MKNNKYSIKMKSNMYNNIIPKYPCEEVKRIQIPLNNQIYPGYSITIISKNYEECPWGIDETCCHLISREG